MRMHSFPCGSNFPRLYLGRCTKGLQPNTTKCLKSTFFPDQPSRVVLSLTLLLDGRFFKQIAVVIASFQNLRLSLLSFNMQRVFSTIARFTFLATPFCSEVQVYCGLLANTVNFNIISYFTIYESCFILSPHTSSFFPFSTQMFNFLKPFV